MKTEHSYRYSKLRRESQLKVVAHEVETEANEMETCRIREQARMMAEEIVRHEIIYKIR